MDFVSMSAFRLTQFGYREQVAARCRECSKGLCEQECFSSNPLDTANKSRHVGRECANGLCEQGCCSSYPVGCREQVAARWQRVCNGDKLRQVGGKSANGAVSRVLLSNPIGCCNPVETC
ncbi:hypothetical protein [Legionella wadsworthii]|nr:hypothetical protein [Legionella wadsworthii]